MNTYESKYQQKSKSISSPEQNYLSLFAMRYPVFEFVLHNLVHSNYIILHKQYTYISAVT